MIFAMTKPMTEGAKVRLYDGQYGLILKAHPDKLLVYLLDDKIHLWLFPQEIKEVTNNEHKS